VNFEGSLNVSMGADLGTGWMVFERMLLKIIIISK